MRRPTNDNEGDVFGPDPFGDTFEKWRVADAAKHIKAGLEQQLQFGSDHIGKLLAPSDSYREGLTNGEIILAVMTALSQVQVTFLAKLGGMSFGPDEDESEEA